MTLRQLKLLASKLKLFLFRNSQFGELVSSTTHRHRNSNTVVFICLTEHDSESISPAFSAASYDHYI